MSHRVPRPRLSHDLYKDLERIIVDPEVMGGVPCIGGLHVPVSTVVEMTVDGMSYEEILDEIPLLEAEDIEQGLEYAARAILRFLALPFYSDAIPRLSSAQRIHDCIWMGCGDPKKSASGFFERANQGAF